MIKKSKEQKTKIFCNECQQELIHFIIGSANRKGSDQIDREFSINWSNEYQILECQGCRNITYRTKHWNSESQFSHYETDYEYLYYPPLTTRIKPNWYDDLDERYQDILDEVYIAANSDIRFLATFGVRTALDVLIVDKIGDIGSFTKKLNNLLTNGHINQHEHDLLQIVIYAGSAAAHKGYKPEQEGLNSIMDIVESLFEQLCIKPIKEIELAKKAQELKKKVPPR